MVAVERRAVVGGPGQGGRHTRSDRHPGAGALSHALPHDVEITALAWAITVTPGTLVTVIGDDEMWVHVVLGGPRQEMIELLGRTEDRVLSVLRGEDE
ncbi:hypothetical protein DQ226_16795 [Dietzia maris]|uniref:Uncharacterized protein n=1 Tax=Dietzia maris TaxID=37915 RepID=A0A365P6K9_9ACTN|nr:hypothetical protein DQ226_16795 [Dietzia maris]